MRLGDWEFKVILVYIVVLRPVWDVGDTISRKFFGTVWSLLHNGHQVVSSLHYSFYTDLTALVASISNTFNILH